MLVINSIGRKQKYYEGRITKLAVVLRCGLTHKRTGFN